MNAIVKQIDSWPQVLSVVLLNPQGDSFFSEKYGTNTKNNALEENLLLLNFIAKNKTETGCDWSYIQWHFSEKDFLLFHKNETYLILRLSANPDIEKIKERASALLAKEAV